MSRLNDHIASLECWKKERGLEPSFPFFNMSSLDTKSGAIKWLIVHTLNPGPNSRDQLNLAEKITTSIGAGAKLVNLNFNEVSCRVLYDVVSHFLPLEGVLILLDDPLGSTSSFFVNNYESHLQCKIEFGPSTQSMIKSSERKIELWRTIQGRVM